MGRGNRHSNSCQIKGYLTYDERNSRTNAFRGLGTIKSALDPMQGTLVERVGSDSQKGFDACWLCNARARGPVVTPHGLLYCKQCILENMAAQKADYRRKLAAFEAQQSEKQARDATAAAVRGAIADEAARAAEDRILPVTGAEVAREAREKEGRLDAAVRAEGRREQAASSFWVTHSTPKWTPDEVAAPDATVRCPFSKKPLKMRGLVDVAWTEQREAAGAAVQVDSDTGRYMCPVTNATFHNGSDIVVLPNGVPVSKAAYEKFCFGEQKAAKAALPPPGLMPPPKLKRKAAEEAVPEAEKEVDARFRCPVTGDMLKRKGVVTLVRAGTGFAASNTAELVGNTEAKRYRPSLTMGIS